MSRPGRRWGRLPGTGQVAGRRRAAALVAGALAVVVGGAGAVPAQVPTLPGASSTTTAAPTTTAPPADPTTTTSAPEPSDTTVPPPEPDPAVPPDEGPPADPAPGPVADDPGPVVDPGSPTDRQPAPGEVPAGARRAIASVRRSGPNSTRRLLAALEPLEDLGFTRQEAIAAGFGRFPVGGYATFTHDWLFPRYTPSFHLHLGTDIFAVTGTPVRSPADGTLRLTQGGAGGLAAYVYQSDGTYFYLAHLSAFVPGQKPGQKVRVGEVVGYVGDSGNAKGGSPHVHFEIHPAPTRAVSSGSGRNRTVTHVVRPVPIGTVLPAADPKATLDQWLFDALLAVPRLLTAAEGRPRAITATAATRGAAGGRAAAFPAPVSPPRAHLLWASSASPSGGAVELAEAEALVAASEFDWSRASRREQEQLEAQVAARARTTAILGPLTPPALRPAPANDA